MRPDQPSRAGLADIPTEVQSAQILLPDQFDGPGDPRLLQAVTALASIIGLPSDTITIVQVVDGEAELDVPWADLQRLRHALKTNDARLRILQMRRIGLEIGFGRREDWVLDEGRYQLRPPRPAPVRPLQPVRIQFLQPFLVAALVGCVAYAAAELALLFWPDLSQLFLTLAPVIAAVESGYSNQLIRHRRLLTDEAIRFRTVELLLLLVLIKAGTYLGQSPAAILEDIRRWPHDPRTIVDIDTVLAVVFCLVAWRTTTLVMNDLRRLGEPPEKSRYYVSPLDNLSGRFFWGGAVLLLLIGLSSIGRVVPELADRSLWTLLARLRRSTMPDMVLVLLAYHMLGLLLLGQVQLALLRKRWQAQSLAVDECLGRRWLVASLALVALALVVAFLLPTGYTVGFLHVVAVGIAWIFRALTYLGSLILFLFGLLLAPLLALLFGSGRVRPLPGDVPQFQPPLPAPTAAGPPPEWLLLMRTILFWALVAAAVVYLIIAYLRDHPELLAWLVAWRPLAFLRRLWAAVRRLCGCWEATIRQRLATLDRRIPSQAPASPRPFRFLRLSALPPRERILYYYWSLLKRAGQWGLPRRPAETPREYRTSLQPHLPEVEGEMAKLTDAFIEARYSQHPVDAADVQSVKEDWQKVKHSLRMLKRARSAPSEPDVDDG